MYKMYAGWKKISFTCEIHTLCKLLKLMKGKALRKHSLHEKTAASVLLKLFIKLSTVT